MADAVTIWLTGLSGAGKSTIAHVLEDWLSAAGRPLELLDGDVVRTHLSAGLGFSKADRDTNVKRIGWVCQLLNRHGVDALVAAISPYREARDAVRAMVPNFVEVHVHAPIEVLAQRDVKSLYKKALAGEIANFTGVSDPYEAPLNPEITIRTDSGEQPDESALRILELLERRGLVTEPAGGWYGHWSHRPTTIPRVICP